MADNIHEVVKLLVARMESHPEEFDPNRGGRWAEWLEQLIPLVTEEERVILRGPLMQGIHEEVLDELLNGEERRAQAQRERDLAMQQMMGARHSKSLYAQAMRAGGLQGIGVGSVASKEALRIGSGGELQIGDQTLDENMLRKIRKAVGL